MSFTKKNLNPNETVALDMHPHWWYFAEPAAALVGAIVLGIVVAAWDDSPQPINVLAIVLIVGCALWLVKRYLSWMTTHFVITSQRIVFRTGIIAKSGIEIPLDRVNNVNFNQSIFERMLGAGDLLIESGGEDGQSRYTDIRKPEQVQRLIHQQIEAGDMRKGGYAASASSSADVAGQLERLEGMLQRGTLSQDEFDLQKRKLLGM
jgi:uncharacterized membrane protein YdbT with pleckstrin-like domain